MSDMDTAPGAQPQVEWLDTDECWRHLQDAVLCRLAMVDADGHPAIYPVNIRVRNGAVLIRSAEDAKVRSLMERPRVALETDGGALRVRWSVIAHGTAEVTGDVDDSDDEDDTGSWFPGEKSCLIRITVEEITGKRFLAVAPA
jgi:nitroimidazol reductase NimA-like FMN-containing flavoprotein (pyridoxamine 5'-phosphate oxidase superfamily)